MNQIWRSGGKYKRILNFSKSFMPRPFYRPRKTSGIHQVGGWLGPRAGWKVVKKRKISYPIARPLPTYNYTNIKIKGLNIYVFSGIRTHDLSVGTVKTLRALNDVATVATKGKNCSVLFFPLASSVKCVCVCIYIYTYTHTHIYIYTQCDMRPECRISGAREDVHC
jgi:hypothetical protein